MIYEEPMPHDEDTAPRLPTTSLEMRKSHKYVDSYRHLDTHEYLGTVVTQQYSSVCTDPEDPCEPTRIIKLVKVQLDNRDHSKPLWSEQDIVQALKDTFTSAGCAHEYDCCGCWSHHVTDVMQRRLYSDEYVLILSASRNY